MNARASNDDRQRDRPTAYPLLSFFKRVRFSKGGRCWFIRLLPQAAVPEWQPAC